MVHVAGSIPAAWPLAFLMRGVAVSQVAQLYQTPFIGLALPSVIVREHCTFPGDLRMQENNFQPDKHEYRSSHQVSKASAIAVSMPVLVILGFFVEDFR